MAAGGNQPSRFTLQKARPPGDQGNARMRLINSPFLPIFEIYAPLQLPMLIAETAHLVSSGSALCLLLPHSPLHGSHRLQLILKHTHMQAPRATPSTGSSPCMQALRTGARSRLTHTRLP